MTRVVCTADIHEHLPEIAVGYGDQGKGSSALSDAIERLQPRLVLVGHIHPSYGRYRLGETEIINAAYVDNDYRPVNPLVEVEL
jgi:Icc-related predicted phosphoesterase